MKQSRGVRKGGTRDSGLGTKDNRRRGQSPVPSPQSRSLVSLRPGQKLTLSFRSLNLDGAGVATAGSQRIAVPFALPGEEAIVELTRGGRRPAGKIVSLVRKSAHAAPPPCRHFGVCGGCPAQHLSYAAPLEHKTPRLRAPPEDAPPG